MKRKNIFALATLLAMLGLVGVVNTAGALEIGELVKAGEPFPSIKFQNSMDDAGKKYLGLTGDGDTFDVSMIKGDVLVVELFGLYCLHCRAEAPKVKVAFDRLAADGLGDKIKFLGVGVKNSAFEVQAFRQQLKVAFPGVPDPDMSITKALGVMATPTFVVVKLDGAKSKVLLTMVGDFGEPEAFVQKIKEVSGL